MTTATHTRRSASRTPARAGTTSQGSSPDCPPSYGSNDNGCNTRVLQLGANPTHSSFFTVGSEDVLVDYDQWSTVGDFKRELYAGGSTNVAEDVFALYGYDTKGLPTPFDIDDTLFSRTTLAADPFAQIAVRYAPDFNEEGDFYWYSNGYVLIGNHWKPRTFFMPNQKDSTLRLRWPIVGGASMNSVNTADYDIYLPSGLNGYPKTPYFSHHILVLKHKQPSMLDNTCDKELVFCFRSFARRDMVFWKLHCNQVQLKAQALQQATDALTCQRSNTQSSGFTGTFSAFSFGESKFSFFSKKITPAFLRRARARGNTSDRPTSQSRLSLIPKPT